MRPSNSRLTFLVGVAAALAVSLLAATPRLARAQCGHEAGRPCPEDGAPTPPQGQDDALDGQNRGPFRDANNETPLTAPPRPGEPDNPSGDGGNSGNGSGGGITRIFHIIQFPFETMTEAVLQMTGKILKSQFKAAGVAFAAALDSTVFGPYGLIPRNATGGMGGPLRGAFSTAGVAPRAETAMFRDIVRPGWNLSFQIALILLPATLALTAVSAMRAGATSVLGYADLKEALIGWVIAAGVAAASYYLLSLAHRLSIATSFQMISLAGHAVNGTTLAKVFFDLTTTLAVATALAAVLNVGLAAILVFMMGFALFLGIIVLLGLAFASAAYVALLYLLCVLAPIVIVLGTLPPLRWLHFLWTKALTIAFLVGPANALILALAVRLFMGFGPTHVATPGTWLAGMVVTAGAISMLITLDYKLGEFIFGALGEVYKNFTNSVMGVAGLVAAGVGMAAAGPVAGAIGGAIGNSAARTQTPSSSSSPGAGDAGATPASNGRSSAGSAPASSGTHSGSRAPESSGGGPASALTGSQFQARTAQIASGMGRALAMGSQNPIAKGFGLGMMVGGDMNAHAHGAEADSARESRWLANQQTAPSASDSRAWQAVSRVRGTSELPEGWGRINLNGAPDLVTAATQSHIAEAKENPAAARDFGQMVVGAARSHAQQHGGSAPQAYEGVMGDFYRTLSTNRNYAPDELIDHMRSWRAHGQLPADWESRVRALYGNND